MELRLAGNNMYRKVDIIGSGRIRKWTEQENRREKKVDGIGIWTS